MTPNAIQREITIDAPVERVWSLVTEAEHLGRWFGDAGAEIDLRPGRAMRLRWARYGTALCRVEAVEPPTRFAYRWVPGGTDEGQEPTPANSTLVEFTLTAEGGATRVRVVESGFSGLAKPEAQRAKAMEDNTEGWRLELDELAGYATRAGV